MIFIHFQIIVKLLISIVISTCVERNQVIHWENRLKSQAKNNATTYHLIITRFLKQYHFKRLIIFNFATLSFEKKSLELQLNTTNSQKSRG